MKILILNDFLVEGGAEIYVYNLIKLLQGYGHQIKLITFDNEFEQKIKNYDIDLRNIINFTITKKDKMVFNKKLYNKIRGKIQDFEPDRIIVNNFFASPFTQYKALQGYKAYQIVHDYHLICPKSTYVKEDYSICKGCNKEKCLLNCKYHNSKLILAVKYFQTKKLSGIRKKYISQFIAPSEKLTECLVENGYNAICINNPIDMKFIEGQEIKIRNIENSKNFIYVGMINERKGIFKFLDAFIQFSEKNNVKLKIIGKCSSEEDKKVLNRYLENKNIEFLGRKDNKEVLEHLKQSNFMVVPSLWMENYPTTVLEGMLTKNLILGSNRGGISDMLKNGKGICFDILDKDDIIRKLEIVYKIDKNEYSKIVNTSYDFVIKNNSYTNYYNKVMEIL